MTSFWWGAVVGLLSTGVAGDAARYDKFIGTEEDLRNYSATTAKALYRKAEG